MPTLAALRGASPGVAVAILDGLMSGWPTDKSPTLTAADKQTLESLMQSLPESARDRSEILTDILDPNRSVEANYRLWNVTTKDGDTFSGRLEAETQTTVEILDTAAQKHVVQRKDIASLDASQLSIMPTGFEALPPEDLKALLEYLCQPHQ